MTEPIPQAIAHVFVKQAPVFRHQTVWFDFDFNHIAI
jgi:hypothetical protein